MSLESKYPIFLDVRQLIHWLGLRGARAGLLQSKEMTVETLTELAKSMGIITTKSSSRQHLVDEILNHANKRIDKSLDELYKMNRDEIMAYFERVEPSSEELLDLLRSFDFHPRKEGHRSLMELAARELSETSRFLRISTSVSKPEDRNG